MKLKRIISLILSVMLIFSAVSSLGFAEDDTEKVYGRESIGILSALGITEMTDNKLIENIKRADYLKMMSIVTGYGASKYENQLFADLPLNDAREPYVRALYDAKAITADSAGKIYPDAEIGMAEAVSIAVKLAGYSLVAEGKGGYPTGYINVAKQKGFLDNLPTNPYMVLTNGMALQLIENTLKADLMIQTGFGSESGYEEKQGANFLGTIFGVTHIEDVLKAVDISRVIGENDVPSEFIEIAGITLEARSIGKTMEELYTFLGYRVNVYYIHERGDIPKAIHIEKSNKNSEKVFELEDIASVSRDKIKVFDEKGKKKTHSFKSNLPVIYNGVSTKQVFNQSLINGKSGTIRLVDNTGDSATDLIFLDIYESFVVSQVDSKTGILYDKYDNKNKLTVDLTKDEPYTIIYDEYGNEISVKAITEDTVLAIFKSAPDAYQGFVKICVVDKTVEGEIAKLKDNGKIIVIDDIEYEVTDKCKNKHGYLFKPGQNISLKLDYSGKVIWASVKASAADYAYGFIVATETGGGLGGELKLKLYTTTEKFEIYDLADKVKIDGKSYSLTDVSNILKVLKKAALEMFNTTEDAVSESFYSSCIRYLVNDENEISAIDTLLNNSGDRTKRSDNLMLGDELYVYYSEDTRVRSKSRTINEKLGYNSDTIVIMHPNPFDKDFYDMNDENNYSIKVAGNYFQTDNGPQVNACFTDLKSYRSGVIFVSYQTLDPDLGDRPALSIVNDVYQVYDETSDSAVTAVEVLNAGKSVELKVKDANATVVKAVDNERLDLSAEMTADKLKVGDIITYALDSRGYLELVRLYYRTVDRFTVYPDPKPDDNLFSYGKDADCAEDGHRIGFVYDKVKDGLLVYFVDHTDVNDKSVLENITADDCELVPNASPSHYVFEEGRAGEKTVKPSSVDDLKTYVGVGEDCSTIYIQQSFREPWMIFSI